MTTKTISTYDTRGIFVVLADGKQQGPIVLETEGFQSGFDTAQRRAEELSWSTRVCVCRLVPVSGNELLAMDMIRLQADDEDEVKEMPF